MAISELVETAMIGRAAEALRRHSSEQLLIGVAVSDQAFRTVTFENQRTCACYRTALSYLATEPPLPTTEENRTLQTVVDRVLRTARVTRSVDLRRQRVSDYVFDDRVDSVLVQEAIKTSQDNPVAYDILEGCWCLEPRVTARSRVRSKWPFPIPVDSPAKPPVEEAAHSSSTTTPVRVEEVGEEVVSTEEAVVSHPPE